MRMRMRMRLKTIGLFILEQFSQSIGLGTEVIHNFTRSLNDNDATRPMRDTPSQRRMCAAGTTHSDGTNTGISGLLLVVEAKPKIWPLPLFCLPALNKTRPKQDRGIDTEFER